MSRRSYDQYCPLAISLDVIGDRWAPLVVRELLLGPLRYSDLARGLPGIASDMLTRRLRELEEAGIVARRDLPPPAAATVYELTERGERLREPLVALARWGLELMPPPAAAEDFTPTMFANALQAVLRPRARDRLEVGLVAGGEELSVRIRDGSARSRRGRPDRADLTLRGETGALVAALTGDDPDPPGVEIDGDRAALERLRAMVAIPAAAAVSPGDLVGRR